MAINVNRDVDDTFYRYKMPKLAAKVEGKGNGIKTVIVNVTDIARALYRKPIYLTKYFGCELGAQVYVDDKNERYIVNGAHDAAKLQELLDGFIKKFVLCQKCGNPETSMRVYKKAGTVATVCKACGDEGHLNVAHRLTQYIVKNPPDVEFDISKSTTKKSKTAKNDADKNSDEDNDENAGCDENSHDSPIRNAVEKNDEDDNDWLEDTTEEAQQQRLNSLSSMAKSLALCNDIEKTETERADVFFKHLSKLHKEDSVVSRCGEIKQESEQLNLGPRVVLVLAEVLLNNPSTILNDIKKYAPVFLHFTRSGDEQKRAQHYMWGAIEKLIERHSDQNLLSKSCHLLKQLYDHDIMQEDVILSWSDKGPSKKFVSRDLSGKILERCSPMIAWLREAEEEESGEEDEKISETCDGSIDVHSSANESEEEEFVDIDAI